ncbi:hypothetical protein FWH30_00165, partial [Microgenomates group bacterium]|nr:hypothetical protein [Microgenomates group bacterium]
AYYYQCERPSSSPSPSPSPAPVCGQASGTVGYSCNNKAMAEGSGHTIYNGRTNCGSGPTDSTVCSRAAASSVPSPVSSPSPSPSSPPTGSSPTPSPSPSSPPTGSSPTPSPSPSPQPTIPDDEEEDDDDRGEEQCEAFYVCIGSDGDNGWAPTVYKAGYASRDDCRNGALARGAKAWGGSTNKEDSDRVFGECYETEAEAEAVCRQWLYYCNPSDDLNPTKQQTWHGRLTRAEVTNNPYVNDEKGIEKCSENLSSWEKKYRSWFTEESSSYRDGSHDKCYRTLEEVLAFCDDRSCDDCLESEQCPELPARCRGGDDLEDPCPEVTDDGLSTGGGGEDGGSGGEGTMGDDTATLRFTIRKTDRDDENCEENITWKVRVDLYDAHIVSPAVPPTYADPSDPDSEVVHPGREAIDEYIDCGREPGPIILPDVVVDVTAEDTAPIVTLEVPRAKNIYSSYGQKDLANVGPLAGRITSGDEQNGFESREGECIADWTRLTDPAGIKGMLGNKYGFGGSNGRWIMNEGNAADAGWRFNRAMCRFECIDTQDDDDLSKECYAENNGGLALTPEFTFIPDLRLVVYGDAEFSATADEDGQCVPRQTAVMTSTREEIPNEPSTETAPDTTFDFQISGADYALIELDKEEAIEHHIVQGEDLISNYSFNRYTMSYGLTNSGDLTSYFACMCPSRASGGADCAYQDVLPLNNADICTSKRIYVGKRDCFASAWWQVAGGNVYAYSGMLSRVPTNALTDACTYSQAQCLNIGEENPYLATMRYEGGAGYQDILASRDSAQNCTARMIRGFGACSGNSNSAGVALVSGIDGVEGGSEDPLRNRIEAVNNRDGNIGAIPAGATYVGLAKRLTSRTSSQGITPTPETSGSVGAAGSRVASDGQTAGYTPAMEDFDRMLWLLSSYVTYDDEPLTKARLEREGIGESRPFFTNDFIEGSCWAIKYQVEVEGVTDWVCYVKGDLYLAANQNPLYIRKQDNEYQKVTVLVAGDVYLSSDKDAGEESYGSNNAVTMVDQGNFLGIVAKGNITIEANLGLAMPNPAQGGDIDMELVNQCWEGQTASVNNAAYGGDVGIPVSLNVGSSEGFFMADGSVTVKSYQDLSDCGEGRVWTDKQYIHQGMMVALQQLNLWRDFNNRQRGCQNDVYGIYNNRVPTETFVYRPDLAVNAPSWMRSATVMTGFEN